MFLIIHSVNLSLIKSLGRSDLILKLEIIKKITGILLICVGLSFYGIMGMLYALALNSILELFLNGYYTGKLIGYGTISQISDLAPTFLIAVFTGIISWFALSSILINNILLDFILSGLCYVSLYLLMVYIFKIEALNTFKKIIVNRFYKFINIRKHK